MIYICSKLTNITLMIDPISSGLAIADSSIGILDKILERTNKYKKIKQDTTTFLRLLYIEVLDNMKLSTRKNFMTEVNPYFASTWHPVKNHQQLLRLPRY